jgi:hypothetical protein
MKKKSRLKKTLIIITSIIATIAVVIPVLTYGTSYQPSPTARVDYSEAIDHGGYYHFDANGATQAVIFYPGGLVSPLAYARFGKLLSAFGYDVYITKPFLNLAITSIQQAATIQAHDPLITAWFIGGHSLGGSASAFYAIDHLTTIQGLFFFAAYTTASANFSLTSLPMLSITASEDLVLNAQTYLANQTFDSPLTTYAVIEGGNHSQFGDYGFQRGDGVATITVASQHQQMVNLLVSWFAQIFKD